MKLKKGQFFQWKKADVQLTAISHIHLQERYGSEITVGVKLKEGQTVLGRDV